MDLGIEGLRVLVTAGAGGIGLCTAQTFLREGAKVHVCDIDTEALANLAETGPVPPARSATFPIATRLPK